MEATANKAIIYDDTCPLCVWYTGAFVKTGMLKENNRISFNELTGKSEITEQMNMHRSKHEIPLVGFEGGRNPLWCGQLGVYIESKNPYHCLVLAVPSYSCFLQNLVQYCFLTTEE